MNNNSFIETGKNNRRRVKLGPEAQGLYLNRVLWSDIDPIGKILKVLGPGRVLVQPVYSGKNLTKMEFEPGGFAATCTNQSEQRYEFFEEGDPFVMKVTVKALTSTLSIDEKPRRYYDYNF